MPYILPSVRDEMAVGREPQNAGELNYAITRLVIRYIAQQGMNYQKINDVVGALEGAKQEFYDRVARPYKNRKLIENGDVYPSEAV